MPLGPFTSQECNVTLYLEPSGEGVDGEGRGYFPKVLDWALTWFIKAQEGDNLTIRRKLLFPREDPGFEVTQHHPHGAADWVAASGNPARLKSLIFCSLRGKIAKLASGQASPGQPGPLSFPHCKKTGQTPASPRWLIPIKPVWGNEKVEQSVFTSICLLILLILQWHSQKIRGSSWGNPSKMKT